MSRFACAAVMAGLLHVLPAQAQGVDLARWVGEWQASDEQKISIRIKKGGLRLAGSASWGMSDPERVARGGVNIGDFDVTVPAGWIEGDRLGFAITYDGVVPAGEGDAYSCRVKLRWVESRLDVEDNLMCGVLNVTFSGQYERELRNRMFVVGE